MGLPNLRLVCLYAFAVSFLLRYCNGVLLHGSFRGPLFAENDPSAIPSFLIIGTAKGGTTDLYEQLADTILNSDPARTDPPILRGPRKEFNYLAREAMQLADLLPGGAKLAGYLERLAHPCANVTDPGDLKECVRGYAQKNFTVDATPVNLFGPLAPVNLQKMSPNSKVVVMLRDPIERTEVLFRHVCIDEGQWNTTTLDNLTDSFFSYINEPSVKASLEAISNCEDLDCMAAYWGSMTGFNMMAPKHVKHFSGALYAYSLATWQVNYFKPGRVMVVDSHAYFQNRYSVLEKVIHFLYGRDMTAVEQAQARSVAFWRKGPKALSRAGTNWILSPAHRQKLQEFYGDHVTKHLGWVLRAMRRHGAYIVGFDGKPWMQDPRFGLPP